jgi:hypothetical protein
MITAVIASNRVSHLASLFSINIKAKASSDGVTILLILIFLLTHLVIQPMSHNTLGKMCAEVYKALSLDFCYLCAFSSHTTHGSEVFHAYVLGK